MQTSTRKLIVGFIAIILSLLAIQWCSNRWIYEGVSIRGEIIGGSLLVVRVLIEIFVVSSLLYLGFWISNNKVTFKNSFKGVLISYVIFVIQYFAEFAWLIFHKTQYSVWELNNFSSFSLLNIFSIEKVPLYLIYPLMTANLWEFLFIAVLILFFTIHIRIAVKTVILVVLCAYIFPLLCWVGFICYTNMVNLI